MLFLLPNPILLYTSFVLSSLFFITIRFPKLKGRWIIKGLSIVLLSFFAYFNCIQSVAFLFTIALFFSSLGDFFLGLNEKKLFIQGLVAFLISHIFYSIAFYSQLKYHSLFIVNHFILNIVLIIYAIIMTKILIPKLGNLKIPVIIYISTLIIMGIGGINTKFSNPILIFGVILFIISDSLLAIQKFLNSFKGIDYFIWLTYYLAQLFIVFGALKT